jgi:soluble lytic murein transglycosylase
MQLMPATASDTDPDVERASLIEAESNVRVGAKYLKHLMNRFKGNIVLSLAGYNAGPNAVDRWVKESGGKRGMLEFIETIPYKETREYV